MSYLVVIHNTNASTIEIGPYAWNVARGAAERATRTPATTDAYLVGPTAGDIAAVARQEATA
jgi:hypothetical protein